MKKIVLFLIILMLSVFSMDAATPAFNDCDDGEEPDEIVLHSEQNGEDPSSVHICYLQAYKTSTHVLVVFSNYCGNASAVVFGLGGSIFSSQQYINGSGILSVDISSLPSGLYSLTVFADTVYSGTFQK